ncbi:MAG TPA: retropepsin-like aspartic protease [Kofleriaceae bacterium]|nr:retropepsin-like aspartic protease [Kofleriaceae bacterium]
MLAVSAVGCTGLAAPSGFSAGDSWTAPMVGPLEDGLLLVPVFINGKGPYLFAIDTDASVSVVSHHVVGDAKLDIVEGPKLDDETDHQRERSYAEVLGFELGTLTVERVTAEVVADHVFDLDGRTIDGLIGRDVIMDSLAFEFDRDRGTITLMTAKAYPRAAAAFTAPPLAFKVLPSKIDAPAPPVAKKLVTANVDGTPLSLHLDFGASPSQLRDRSWDKAKLASVQQRSAVIDEVGTPRAVERKGVAATVTLGPATASNVEFVPYGDKRWRDEDFDGTLGLDFFAGQTVLVNWGQHQVYLKPRVPPATGIAARIGRWQSSLMPACEHTGCATVNVVDPLANIPPEQRPPTHPGVVVSVVRDAKANDVALEVVIAVKGADPANQLQWLVANLPPNVDRAITHLPPGYLGAELKVVDASPFPRVCPADGGCIDTLRPPA